MKLSLEKEQQSEYLKLSNPIISKTNTFVKSRNTLCLHLQILKPEPPTLKRHHSSVHIRILSKRSKNRTFSMIIKIKRKPATRIRVKLITHIQIPIPPIPNPNINTINDEQRIKTSLRWLLLDKVSSTRRIPILLQSEPAI